MEDNSKNDAVAVFGQDGLLSKFHSDFEFREGQVEMSAAAIDALSTDRHLVVEAGTGTGKTLAYLIPAINEALRTGKRIVISTGTKNLQEQLMEKDIPFLKKIFPKKFIAVYMKGRSNYACLYRFGRAADQPILDGIDEAAYFRIAADWVQTTSTGDRAELTDLPENLPFWNRVNAKSESCVGQKCPDFEPCFITRMRGAAENANIIIVNHHLYFADLSLRDNNFGRVIPEHAAVIFDEAHLIEDIAADYFGVQVSSYQIDELVRDSISLNLESPVEINLMNRAATAVAQFGEAFWARFKAGRGGEGRFPLDTGEFSERNISGENQPTPLGEALGSLTDAMKHLSSRADVHSERLPEAESVVKRIKRAIADLEFLTTQPDDNFVYWLERRGRGVYLQSSPVDVSQLLSTRLFARDGSAILTSATLSAGGGFEFIRGRLGLPHDRTDTLIAPSSFDHENQALLYLPEAMPDPRSPEFVNAAASEVLRLITATSGRAFVLCTSNQSMAALYELVSSRTAFPCLVQGSMSKAGLLERFRTTANAVLFATQSFWQGVDVRGEQLSCVIIDKLPFAVPTDPLVAARSRHIDSNGGSAFFEYSVPQAIISLKQGVGRLIRSRSDRGVIAILDPRLRTKGYRRQFLHSLPRMRIVSDVSQVSEFLDQNEV